MKKLFPEKKVSRKGLLDFIDKKGFYIVLILCITIVGATAVFVTTRNVVPSQTRSEVENIIPEDTDSNPVSKIGESIQAQASINSPKPSPVPKSQPSKANAQPNASKGTPQSGNTSIGSKAAPESVVNQKFIRPVFGEITFEYAQDKLVYSKTLEDWRTHSGLDIKADRGMAVKAVADGIVSEIKNDPRLGITIVVEHSGGLKTVYANLASDDMVFPNQKVKQGDILGCVGNTAAFELADQSHLHFEVLKNNEPVNPADYLPAMTPKT